MADPRSTATIFGDVLAGLSGNPEIIRGRREAFAEEQERQRRQDITGIIKSAMAGGQDPRQAIRTALQSNPDLLMETDFTQAMSAVHDFTKADEPNLREVKVPRGDKTVSAIVDMNTGEVVRELGEGERFAPPTQVNVVNQTETEREKALGKALGERMAATLEQSRNLRQRSKTIGMMRGLLGKDGRVQTGAGARLRVMAKNLLNMDMGEDTDELQAFDQLSKGLILQAQTEQSGPQTESDRAVIAATVPNINKSNSANQLAFDVIEAQDKRAQEELALEQKLLAQGLDPFAVDQAIEAHFADRPVFSDDIVKRSGALAPTVESSAPRLRFDEQGNLIP